MKRLLLLLVLAAPAAAGDRIDNWPQWRGPLATGVAPRGDPPLKWDEKTNVRWKVGIPGKGSSTPVVWDDRVFVTTAVDTGRKADARDVPVPNPGFEKRTQFPLTYHQFLLICLDRATGKEQWRRVAAERVPHEGHHGSHSYGGFSPATDGRFVYCWFGSHGVHCYDFAGNKQWSRELGRMETRLGWGEAGAPVVHGDTVLINFDHEDKSFLTALDARTGQPRWKVDRNEPSTWSTPLVVEHKGRTQVVTNGTNRVRAYDLATGKVLWQAPGLTVNPIPSPVADDRAIYCIAGYKGAVAVAVPLDAEGELGDDRLLWKHRQGTPYVPSALLTGGRLYFTASNDARLSILDARTGKVLLDRERLPEVRQFYASPAAARDRVYLVSREGTTLVLKQGDKLEVLATNRLDDPIDASPVIVGQQLLLRGHEHLYCLEEK